MKQPKSLLHRGGGIGVGGGGREHQVLVNQRRQGCADEGADPVDRVVLEVAADDGRSEGPRRVHGPPREGGGRQDARPCRQPYREGPRHLSPHFPLPLSVSAAAPRVRSHVDRVHQHESDRALHHRPAEARHLRPYPRRRNRLHQDAVRTFPVKSFIFLLTFRRPVRPRRRGGGGMRGWSHPTGRSSK